jgi:hypothetical protein
LEYVNAKPIKEGEVLGVYSGDILPTDLLTMIFEDEISHDEKEELLGSYYSFLLKDPGGFDDYFASFKVNAALSRNAIAFFNHSEDSNVGYFLFCLPGMKPVQVMYAREDVAEGDELSIDYGSEYDWGDKEPV